MKGKFLWKNKYFKVRGKNWKHLGKGPQLCSLHIFYRSVIRISFPLLTCMGGFMFSFGLYYNNLPHVMRTCWVQLLPVRRPGSPPAAITGLADTSCYLKQCLALKSHDFACATLCLRGSSLSHRILISCIKSIFSWKCLNGFGLELSSILTHSNIPPSQPPSPQ